MLFIEFSWQHHAEYDVDRFAIGGIKFDRFREFY